MSATPASVPERTALLPWLRQGAAFLRNHLVSAELDHTRSAHLTGVILLTILLLLPMLLSPAGPTSDDPTAISFFGITLPGVCMSRQLFNVSCPGCGLTRSFVAFAHGDFRHSLSSHRLGPLLYVYFVFLLALHAYGLYARNRILPRILVMTHHWAGLVMVALLIGNWIWNLFT